MGCEGEVVKGQQNVVDMFQKVQVLHVSSKNRSTFVQKSYVFQQDEETCLKKTAFHMHSVKVGQFV